MLAATSHHARRSLAALLIACCLAPELRGQASLPVVSPLAGAETRILANGLKVWFLRTPGLSDAAVSMSVPYGADRDPEGYRQLAHFTEHLMFSDRPGVSEMELKNAIENRGGVNNATTSPDRTAFYAHVRREDGLFAVRWLHTVMTPPLLRRDIIDRERTPVMIEVKAREPGPLEWLNAHLIDPPALRPRGYWRREYDLPSEWERRDDDWTGVHNIDSAAVRAFLARYYVPSRMTLTIIGDLPADSVWSAVTQTFATLPSGRSPPPSPPPRDPGREWRSFSWSYDPAVTLTHRFKRYEPPPAENRVTSFIEYYLGRRLNDQLRFGTHKAAYGVSVTGRARGRTAETDIEARVKPGEVRFAQAVIDSEIAALRDGTVRDSEFAQRRDVVVSTLRTSLTSAAAIDGLVMRSFYNRDAYGDFPDLVTQFSQLSRAQVVDVARRLLDDRRHVSTVDNVVPLPQIVLALLAMLWISVPFVVARALLIRPLPMTTLRYVARIRRPWLSSLVSTALLAIVVLVVLRLGMYGVQVLFAEYLNRVPSFAIQAAVAALAAIVPFCLILAIRAWIPAKVLVFERGVAIKSYGYRSRFIASADIADVEPMRAGDIVHRFGWRGLLRTRLMSPALRRPALFLRSTDGRAWLFSSRDAVELAGMIREAMGRA